MKLLLQIDGLEKQISRIQQSYGINPSLRSPWSALFPDSRYLTPDEVTKLLMPAAKNAAKQLTPDEAKQFLPSVVKDTPKTAVRGSYAYCRGEERACEATCQSGNFKNMAEVVASDKCLNNCAKAFNACMGDN